MPKPVAVVVVCALAVLSTPTLAQITPVARIPDSRAIYGTWHSTRGPVSFELGGAGTVGRPFDSLTRLRGFFVAGIFMGHWWVETYSGQRCATAIYDGQHYWGRFRLAFEGGTFRGRWAACDAPLESGEPWNGSNGMDLRPSSDQWIFRDATLRAPAADALGPGCRLAKADGGETWVEFDIRCPGAGGKEQKTTGRLNLDIRRPKGWVPGLMFKSEGKLKVTGAPGAGATASCRIGLEGEEGTPLFAPVSASPGKEASSKGEAAVPGPPACPSDDACPRMTIVCSIAGASPVVMTRFYTWER